MLSYHNDAAVKEKFQARFAAHRAADEVVQGTGFEEGRGCFVGCTLDNYDHAQFPVELGWPQWLAHLADSIFEGIPKSEAPQFGTDLLAAVPIGVDLEKVRFILAVRRHEEQILRLAGNPEPYAEQCRLALQSVVDYCRTQAGPGYENARSAESAWSAARSAAELAELAAWSARSAARSAAESAAWSAWQTERDFLLSTLRSLGA